jgi:hypothetical protein
MREGGKGKNGKREERSWTRDIPDVDSVTPCERVRFPRFRQNVAQDVVYSRDDVAVTPLPSNSVSCSIGVARSAAREFHARRCFFLRCFLTENSAADTIVLVITS